MKAILVIDVDDITKFYADIYKEVGKNDEMVGMFYRFIPMPQKKVVTVKRIDDIQSYSITEVADKISAKIILKTNEVFALGWNACLEEILGETE